MRLISHRNIELLSFCSFFCVLGETRVTTPTAIETQLPWKRNEDDAEGLQQNEFPAWASNKEYLAYNSPSATFLGKYANSHLFFLFFEFYSVFLYFMT